MLTETEIAYIAGFFDGEGSVYVEEYIASKNGKTYRRIKSKMCQNDPRPLRMIQKEYGGFIWESRTSAGNRHFELQLASRKTRRFIKDVLPFLIVKRENAERVLSWDSINVKAQRLPDVNG